MKNTPIIQSNIKKKEVALRSYLELQEIDFLRMLEILLRFEEEYVPSLKTSKEFFEYKLRKSKYSSLNKKEIVDDILKREGYFKKI